MMEGKFTAHCTAFGNMEREYYEKAMKADQKHLNLYRMFHEQGVICLCTTCGKKNYCMCSAVDLSAECYECCVARIEREEQEHLAGLDRPVGKPKPEPLKNFDYEDFIKI